MPRALVVRLLPLLWLAPGRSESGTDSGKTGAEFLQSMVRRMHAVDGGFSDFRPTPRPPGDLHHYDNEVGLDVRPVQEEQEGPIVPGLGQGPGLGPLSKSELLSLYQAALSKGTGLDLSSLPQLPLEQEPPHQDTHSQHHQVGDELVSSSAQGTLPGYYYYFYPIKSFMPNGLDGSHNGSHHDMVTMMMMDNNSMADTKESRLDPLFLAMAGFVGVATIVSFSILFLPKFGDGRGAQLKTADGGEGGEIGYLDRRLAGLTRVVGQALHGRDCTERLSCELGRAIRSMRLGSEPVRVVEAFLPPHLAKQMARVRQYVVTKEKCQAIGCKPKPQKPTDKRNKTAKPVKQPAKQNNKNQHL